MIAYRYLPTHIAPEGAMHGPVESIEDAAELGLGGVPPAFPDTVHADDELAELTEPNRVNDADDAFERTTTRG